MKKIYLSIAIVLISTEVISASVYRYRLLRKPPSVNILLTDDAQSIVNAHPAGTRYVLANGIHRNQTISPKAGDIYASAGSAVLSGAILLTSPVTSGSFWKYTGQTQETAAHGFCQSDHTRCDRNEELFIDNLRKDHVATIGELGAGKWFFNYVTDEIYIGDDPAGKTVETSVTQKAFLSTANNVTIDGLIIEKFANAAQSGAVDSEFSTGWTIQNSDVRFNHGAGIRTGTNITIFRNRIQYQGEIGLAGDGDNILILENRISYNGEAHFDFGWEGGAFKIVNSNNLVVKTNVVSFNEGPGIWLDINNINSLIDNNTVEDNHGVASLTVGTPGILHEISYAAIISNNEVRRNGFPFTSYIWGACILVAESPNVEVFGNTCEDNGDGIAAVQLDRSGDAATHGPHEVENLYVHDNFIKMSSPGWNGLAQGVSDTSYFTSRNNRWDRNTYLTITNTNYFTWFDLGDLAFSVFKGTYSQEASGSITVY